MEGAMQKGGQKTPEELNAYAKAREIYCGRHASVMVDGFRFSSQYLSLKEAERQPEDQGLPWRTIFILSHFHSDHYTGLYPTWRFGKLYTGVETARAVVNELGVDPSLVVGLDFGVGHRFNIDTGERCIAAEAMETGDAAGDDGAVDGTSPMPRRQPAPPSRHRSGPGVQLAENEMEVTLIPANHCPGAAVLLFKSKRFGIRVHTGDFRYNGTEAYWRQKHAQLDKYLPAPYRQFMGDNEHLTAVVGKVDVLYLDDTFCDPAYAFAPQAQAFREVHSHVQRAIDDAFVKKFIEKEVVIGGLDNGDGDGGVSSNQPRTLRVAVLVGTYTVGKERVAVALRRQFGLSTPVWVSDSKFELLSTFGFSSTEFHPAPPGDVEAALLNMECDVPLTENMRAMMIRNGIDPKDVNIKLTLFLVPLGTLSYMSLAEAQGFKVKKKNEGVTDGKDNNKDATTKTEVKEEPAAENEPSSIVKQEGSLRETATTDGAAEGAASVDAATEEETLKQQYPSLPLWENFSLPLTSFDAVVGIEPTGWANGRSSSRKFKKVGRVVVHSVPYSEHSSFPELLAFVKFLQPAKIIPTVSQTTFKKQEPLFVEKCPRLVSRYSNVQPLSKFGFGPKKPSSSAAGRVDSPPESAKSKQTNPFAANSGGLPHARARPEMPSDRGAAKVVDGGEVEDEDDDVQLVEHRNVCIALDDVDDDDDVVVID